ncbi:uncharacterized protein LOC135470608 [Liolophura sinensis]|uniref:uncharacterized protein LOC135470608 n=1 Tax=Liolophura sinensis TaxID=3198878 RepID=UPI0031597AC7
MGTMKAIIPGFLPALIFLLSLQSQIVQISSDGKLSIKFLRYENPLKFKYNLFCCDGEYRSGQCTGGCDHRVRVCIDHLNSTDDIETCPLGRYELGGVAFEQGSFDFPSSFLGGLPNPFPVSLQTWEGGVQVKIMIYDQDTGIDELIDDFRFDFTDPEPAVDWSPSPADYNSPLTLVGLRPTIPSGLTVALEAYCDVSFYGPSCSVNCVPENDCLGHYECNKTTGENICLPGWTGSNCATRIPGFEDCSPDQNCNSGTCVPQGANASQYYCCCDAGYTGDFCDQDVDECASNPCVNGGTCTQPQPNSFLCSCPLLFSGPTCERRKTCADNPCLNNGMCFPGTLDSFQCACVEGFTGEFCESLNTPPTRPTTTVTTPTQSTTTTPAPRPFCEPNYYGPSCSVYCKSDPGCDSGYFTCDPKTGEKLCSEGWMGQNCDTRNTSYVPDAECPDSFCRNGAFCKNSTCCCAAGYTGRLCHIEILECDSNPCVNGGKCRDRIGDFLCDCPSGYSGRNCELIEIDDVQTTTTPPVNPCDSLACDNGGTCIVDENVGAVCLCPQGYNGPSCRNATNPITNTVCPQNRYGPGCDVVCTPADNCAEGHYDCHYSTGERICLAGWAGVSCQERFLSPNTDPECPENECRNGGQCFNGSCCCPRGFTGNYCEQEVFECSSRPCLNDGNCVELISGFECDCADGYTGDLCEVNQTAIVVTGGTTPSGVQITSGDLCRSDPCLNNGVCVHLPSGFECFCPDGYTGYLCESSISTTPVPVSDRTTTTPVPVSDGTTTTPAPVSDSTTTTPVPVSNSTTTTPVLVSDSTTTTPVPVSDSTTTTPAPVSDSTTTTPVPVSDSTTTTPVPVSDSTTTTPVPVSDSTTTNLTTGALLCSAQPCLNDGACVQLQNGVECRCKPGFLGNVCQYNDTTTVMPSSNTTAASETTQPQVCRFDSCQNNGICVQRTTSFECTCLTGFTGYFCESRIAVIPTRVSPTTNVTDNSTTISSTPFPTLDPTNSSFTPVVIVTDPQATSNYSSSRYTGSTTPNAPVVTEQQGSANVTNVTSGMTESTTVTTQTTTDNIQMITDDNMSSNSTTSSISSVPTSSDVKHSTPTTTKTTAIPTETETSTTATTTKTTTEQPTTTTPVVTTPPSTSFVSTIYVYKWWKFLDEEHIIDILRYGIYLRNLARGVQQTSIRIQRLEKYDTLDPRGRNVGELVYNASLVEGLDGPLLPPTIESIGEAIRNRGYNIRIYEGPKPWRYMYHYDLYYKAKRTDTVRTVTTKLIQAWQAKYPEYQNCECTFVIHIPRRVRYLDRDGSIITRYIYFVLVNDELNNPFVQPGPGLPELTRYFTSDVSGEVTVANPGNLTEYDNHHVIYFTGNNSYIDNDVLKEFLEEAIRNSTEAAQNCSRLEVDVVRKESQIDENGKEVIKVMYTVNCDSMSFNMTNSTAEVWNTLNDILTQNGDGELTVYRENSTLFDTENSYTLYLIGDLSNHVEEAIYNAWAEGSEDIKDCNCYVKVYVVRKQRHVGIYGIQLTAVTYFIAKEGEFLYPEISAPPTGNVFQTKLMEKNVFNPVYKRNEARPYDLHYSVILKSVLMKEAQMPLARGITTTWENNIPEQSSNCKRLAELRKGPLLSLCREKLSKAVYFVNWGDYLISPMDTAPPTTQSFASNAIDVCACQALRRKHVDIEGNLSYTETIEVQKKIEEMWKAKYPGAMIDFKSTEEFVDVKGQGVTRVYFTISVAQRDTSSSCPNFRPQKV